jgi:hypothetical protein
MTLTSAFCATDSTAASSAPDPSHAGSPGGVCAIHQPNLFPRLSTVAKLYAADRWIVLDDVQFARRDYQHRARLAALDEPARQQWLTLPTHLPHGRPTPIDQARLAEPGRSRRTVSLRALAAAGVIPPRQRGARYLQAAPEDGMHALRHAYASVLLDAGESIKALSEYLGHSDPGFTLRTYTHLLPSSETRTRKAIDDAFAEPETQETGEAQGTSAPPAKPMCPQRALAA